MIPKTLKTAVGSCGPNLGFEAKDISVLSLHTSGAMELLFSEVDGNIIKIIVRWRSNEILRYLHVQAEPLMRHFLQLILTHVNYYFLPQQEEVPCSSF